MDRQKRALLYRVLREKDSVDKFSYTVDFSNVNSWDEYFFNICNQVARNSKCFSRHIGATLVRDKSILSTGYNGPPRGVPTCDKRWELDELLKERYGDRVDLSKVEGQCPRHLLDFKSGEGLSVCIAGHAERNALINSARMGVCTKGTEEDPSTLYMSCGIPCTPCLVEIINAGVSEIVVTSLGLYDESAYYLLKESALKFRLYDFIDR